MVTSARRFVFVLDSLKFVLEFGIWGGFVCLFWNLFLGSDVSASCTWLLHQIKMNAVFPLTFTFIPSDEAIVGNVFQFLVSVRA